ncbi:putative unusual protein kinase regulating ubiquinone biosynthesis (AarF/ABC1/UbiB family) [Novosphingobium chloroacetimidivorans]|uniref:Putative unusual protein kinase regulating ubiquinone biosynthesis (AarF/ABC1/UbiB family) n=1 Tax=Novosphingobium chloroacetimidivorans TaxID=1428314 RepID=A0A7W7K9U6_9SPHN|nr:AarF/ABC1/UbiB kinase family protein [Novosphingobium chloroacetimidivorans]MBB4858897.1 putative unusual protein kinase regulating ubiquinone biosynthesis (AarF/ABC1/UbiB family) [Novosphingobium chloroacetimidivorans]
MTDSRDPRSRAVPSGRLARLGSFGRLAGGVAGGIMVEGARRLVQGERPRLGDLILTPANAARLADRLAHLRGAAMKLGQMISMDAGDVLPAELSTILARLRDQAQRMPPAQLDRVLKREWGADWRRRFQRFEATPIAAASIGQVHRATLPDGRVLAIKVQYPGVADSIDADVDNVATLLRLSNLLPATIDLSPLLAEAKRQLVEETDYLREGRELQRFGALLAGDRRYVVPELEEALTTSRVLAMSFVEGSAIETLGEAPQDDRDAAMTSLIELVLRELFVFGVMQTDPNFANYRWQPEAKRLVLLDFGAARPVAPDTADAYRALLEAGLARDLDRVRETAVTAGFIGQGAVAAHRPALDRIIVAIDAAMNRPGPFDFGDRAFVPVVRQEAERLLADKGAWHVPPAETLFVQRKVSGTALLAARLKARVPVRELAASAIASEGPSSSV